MLSKVEFMALKTAVDEAFTLRYYAQLMGLNMSIESILYVDNMGVILNATNLTNSINKKNIALA